MHIDVAPILDDLQAFITAESPSSDRSALDRCADVVDRVLRHRLGASAERIVVDGITHLRVSWGVPRILILAHYDTVWPLGTLASIPWSVEAGVVRGPGCFDMKLGLAQAVHALAAVLRSAGRAALDGVTLLVTGDEETGSATSRALIEETAAGCVAALILEASADGGALKTARKGVSLYEVKVTGRASHAGLEPEAGINAAVAIAELTLAIARLGAPELGTSVTPTVLRAGTTTNTVPAQATLAVDVRAGSAYEQRRVDDAIQALRTSVAGAVIEVAGGVNRPPLESAATAGLFERAARVSVELDLPSLTGVSVGGGSDGNFTAGVGVPTLDGLGAVGGGAHAVDEHALVEWIEPRTALLAGLILDLGGD